MEALPFRLAKTDKPAREMGVIAAGCLIGVMPRTAAKGGVA